MSLVRAQPASPAAAATAGSRLPVLPEAPTTRIEERARAPARSAAEEEELRALRELEASMAM